MAYEFEVTARSAAPPDRVFSALADAPGWPQWAGPLIRRCGFEREGTPAPGGIGAIRRAGVPPVWGREEVVRYEPPHRYSYVLRSGLPVRDYRADVTLTESGSGTDIVWRGGFSQVPPGMGAPLRAFLKLTVGRLARGLASYAERSR
jgi:uncharacterized protein YndB with AHSA1/START domain